jgi:P27 family predicted phage terminase small subunit
MAGVGRPPKPTELKVITGNPGKRPLPENEPKPKPITGHLEPPDFLNEHAAKMWQRLFPILKNINLITEADIESFTMLCQSYGVWVECEYSMQDVGRTDSYTNKGGNTNETEHTLSKVGQKAFERYKSLCTEFGLTPASRSRIQVNVQEDVDEMEALLTK